MQFLRTDGIKVRPHGMGQIRNHSQACLFYTEENTQLFVLKKIMASYGWNSPLIPFWML